MATVRSIFELAVPLFTKNKIRPLSYLGDGLLAVAQGDEHRRRGLAFACDLIRKAERITLVRHALGDAWGLRMRAGVASGPVVLGTLGSHFKLEFAAIGVTTNLAARLQGQANRGEVVCQDEGSAATEAVSLKGFDRPINIKRFSPGR